MFRNTGDEGPTKSPWGKRGLRSGGYLKVLVIQIWRIIGDYPSSHNHGSEKWLYLKGNYYWRDPFFTSMFMGGRVVGG